MSKLRYAVLRCGDDWRVVGGERRIGRYIDQTAAVAAGARLATEAARMGHEVEFLVQDEVGELTRRELDGGQRPS